MDRNYVVILQAVKLDTVTERIELAEFDRLGNAEIFAVGKARAMWASNYKAKKAKSPSVREVFYSDKEQHRIEIFIQPRLVKVEKFGRANAPQT